MNFRIDKNAKAVLLMEELREYEAITEMTAEERSALNEWVFDGNSVYENGSTYSGENGRPMAFLDVYRYEEEIFQDLKKLTPPEQELYIAKLHGKDITKDTDTDGMPF